MSAFNFFAEVENTNRTYCRSLGLDCDTYDKPLSDIELCGSPLSPSESEIARFQARRINRKSAVMFAALNGPAVGMSGKTAARQAPAPHCVVEYAMTPARRAEQDARIDASITHFYDDCRSGYSQRAGVWTGD